MPTYVHLVRHAQGYHNLCQENHALPDPDLTDLGKEQCRQLYESFPHHDKITHLVASPMRRTIYTCLLSFRPDSSVPGKPPIVALPDIQEVSPFPCDIGSAPDKLLSEFSDSKLVDLGLVKEGWSDKGPGSEYAPEPRKLHERAKRAREWFAQLGRDYGGEKEMNIVAVTHGGFLHFLTEDFEGVDYGKGTGWGNTEWRTYEVVEQEEENGGVKLRETQGSWKRRRGSATGLTETEQMELRAAFSVAVERDFGTGKGKGE